MRQVKIIPRKYLAKECVVVDKRTGKEAPTKITMGMLPAAPGLCPECAVDHKPDQPHNAQSMFYQYKFYNEHGRWPKWKDAIAHCLPEVKSQWIKELRARGQKV